MQDFSPSLFLPLLNLYFKIQLQGNIWYSCLGLAMYFKNAKNFVRELINSVFAIFFQEYFKSHYSR